MKLPMGSPDPRVGRLLAKLEASDLRVTPQRLAVCEALFALGGHPTATDLWRYVHALRPSISQATVYNTIAALENLGLIRQLDIAGDEHAHYDVHVEPHINVVCTACRTITDVYTDTLEALLGLVASRSGYLLPPSDGIIVYGLCPRCRAAAKAEG